MNEYWIDVTERWPDGRPIVLMYLENKQYVVDHFVTKWGSDRVAVTHWQPLLPPKAKVKEWDGDLYDLRRLMDE